MSDIVEKPCVNGREFELTLRRMVERRALAVGCLGEGCGQEH